MNVRIYENNKKNNIRKVINNTAAYPDKLIEKVCGFIIAKCISKLAIVNSNNSGIKNKFRYCLMAIIGFANIKATTGKNDKSIIIDSVSPKKAGNNKLIRPSNHSANKIISILPCAPRTPVQFCTAVNKNPATIAQPKPKIIS